jgi:hypothetical protein
VGVPTCEACGTPLAANETSCAACSAEVAGNGAPRPLVGPLSSLDSWNWFTFGPSSQSSTDVAPPGPAPVPGPTAVSPQLEPDVSPPVPTAVSPQVEPDVSPPVPTAVGPQLEPDVSAPVPAEVGPQLEPDVSAPVAAEVSAHFRPAVSQPVPADIGTGFGANVSTHLTPDAGIQAYPQAYPPYPAKLGPFVPGGITVQVVAVRGTWAHVFADGEDQGWVEGTRLVPPIGTGVRYAPAARGNASAAPSERQRSISYGQMVGVVGALGMIVGALVSWTQIVAISAFRIPVQFLIDNKTHSHQPRLGWFIVVLGILGLVACFVHGAERWRTIVGIFGALIVALFLIQVASGLSGASLGPFGAHLGFTDIVGVGPWITGIAAIALGVSPTID